jgi:hypothetical protein
VAGERHQSGEPLTEQVLLRLATDDQRQALRESMIEDVALQRPMYDEWRKELARRHGNA